MNFKDLLNPSTVSWLFLLILVSQPLFSQSDRNGERRLGSSYVITNTTLIPSPGEILQSQHVLFEDGIIRAFGKDLLIPADAQEIKGDSLFVYGGFIDMANKTGVVEPTIPEKPDNFDPSNPMPEIAGIHPHFNVTDYYQQTNPHDKEWRKLGFTLAQKLPLGKGMLPGTSALLIYGQEGKNNLITENQSIYFKFSTAGGVYPNTNLGVMATWRDLIQNARLYQQHQEMYAADRNIRRLEKNPVLEALIPVIKGQTPVLLEISGELDIQRALKMQDENYFRIILTGINEGDHLIPLLKEKQIGAVLTLNLPEDPSTEVPDGEKSKDFESRIQRAKEAYQKSLALAGKYEAAGIPFALTTKHLPRGDFFKNLQLMIENGLSKEGALAALTVNPAKLLGISDRTGTISEGKMANLLIMTDTLFSENANIHMVVSDGYLFDYSEKPEKLSEEETTWDYEAETEDGKSSGTWKIKQKEGKWTGTITFEDPQGQGMKTTAIENVIITTENMQFSFTVSVKNNTMEVEVSGNLSGEKFSGDMKIVGYGNFPVKAVKRDKPEKSNE
ncbi:amidohydrolase family protein [Cyclobacterium jeungdonense]|uniref:Amidohydrolase family protein n=1 Tax=Cyclobacterium jeungdonense TaxID=708087 RepID=A0ABT8CC42_9BACT|nr:amidohydrolase family protein [Cyclobacterium jeungdonense]MDN3689946.1 amidohydrolase family protein [Cyclobacterium jeungdonense]